MSKQKKEGSRPIPYYWSLVGGILSLYLTRGNSLTNAKELLITFAIFLLCSAFCSWLIFLKNKEKNKISSACLYNMSLTSFLFIGLLLFGYKIGWAEAIFYPSVFLIILSMLVVILFKKTQKLHKSVLILTLIAVTLVAMLVNYNKISGYYCEIVRGGRDLGGECYMRDQGSVIKNILGIRIKSPKDRNDVAIMSHRKGSTLIADVVVSHSGKKKNEKIEAYPQKTFVMKESRRFIMPFSVINSDNSKDLYLGMFKAKAPVMAEAGLGFYNFYDSFTHLGSYFLGKNMALDGIRAGTVGTVDGLHYGIYAYPIVLSYYESVNDSSEKIKKELKLRVEEGPMKYFIERKPCQEVGEIVEKSRGDGEKYKVCSLGENKQCELGLFERTNCPAEGFDVSRYKTEAEIYAVTMGQLISKDGEVYSYRGKKPCLVETYYNGNCE